VDPCKILVATDAVGMGLNLNIRRMVFYSINKVQLTKDGERVVNLISVSQALQIAGRAGRFGTKWETGYVTTFKPEELKPLKQLLKQTPEDILQAGLHPTFDQLEMYAYHLPAASLSNLVDIFISLSTLDDSMYALCHLDDFKFLAEMIEHIKLPLKAKYTFCCAPINRKMPFLCTMFLKMARQYSKGELISFDWLCTQVGWPFSPPDTILDLVHLEAVHDVLDLYLWLSYRFSDMFPDVDTVRQIQQELDRVVEEGVANLVQLLKNSESPVSRRTGMLDEDGIEARNRIVKKLRDTWTHKDAPLALTESDEASENRPNIQFDEDLQQREQSKSQQVKKSNKKPQGKLTKRLIKQGLLTPSMLNQLQKELAGDEK